MKGEKGRLPGVTVASCFIYSTKTRFPFRFRKFFSLLLFAAVSILCGIEMPGSAAAGPSSRLGKANAFVYHRFGETRYPSTNISPEIFDRQLQLLKIEEFAVLPLGEVVARIAAGRPLPEKCAVLTVDDGYSSFWDTAWPILQRYGFPATLFVSTQAVGKPGYMTWDQLRELAASGIEVGNHTVSHPYLIGPHTGETEALWLERVKREVLGAQETFSRELGKAPRLFAYPFGEYTPQVMEEVRKAGFIGAAGQQSGVIDTFSDRYLLPRFPMGGPYGTLEGFSEKLRMKALPVEVLSSASPVMEGENPPVLTFRLRQKVIDPRGLRCFVAGRPDGIISADSGREDVYHVVAQHPLVGRRNKYTLTAPGLEDGSWYWFSQLWINPSVGED